MKCSESPTTSSAADAHAATADAAQQTRDDAAATQAFEAVLASSLMKPLADSLGPVGSFVTEAIASAALDHARSEGLS
jgi:hypothetical protein